MVVDSHAVTVAPIAGIRVVHELADGIELETSDPLAWNGTAEAERPIVIQHELGDARPIDMHPVLAVPPWCTFYVDNRGEPASLFHAVFGEVDRLLSCDAPGDAYVVRYGATPREPVVALQSELAAYSFALAARGLGLIAHSCAFVTSAGDGVLCPGVSGTGKTTLACLLRDCVSGIELLTDDRAIVTFDDRLTLWGSPWPGAARIAGAASAPLTTVVFARHAKSIAMRAVTPAEAFRRIVNTLSMPLWEPARCGRALEIVDAIVSRASLVEASYPPTADAARWLARAVGHIDALGDDAAH